MDDIDNLEGQALADAVAVEVMGWELRGGVSHVGSRARRPR
jgi:hypothetical protein